MIYTNKPLSEMVVLEKILDDSLSDPIWVTHDRHVLHLSDKMIIENQVNCLINIC